MLNGCDVKRVMFLSTCNESKKTTENEKSKHKQFVLLYATCKY